jgi:hypothetical protein
VDDDIPTPQHLDSATDDDAVNVAEQYFGYTSLVDAAAVQQALAPHDLALVTSPCMDAVALVSAGHLAAVVAFTLSRHNAGFRAEAFQYDEHAKQNVHHGRPGAGAAAGQQQQQQPHQSQGAAVTSGPEKPMLAALLSQSSPSFSAVFGAPYSKATSALLGSDKPVFIGFSVRAPTCTNPCLSHAL